MAKSKQDNNSSKRIVNRSRQTKNKAQSWAEVFAGHQQPPLPVRLPRVIEAAISQTPDLLKGTVAQAVPVAFSIYAQGLSFVYIDNRTRELRMNCLLVAHEGGGKECITLPIKHILADIKASDKRNRRRLKEYNEAYNRARQDRDKPERPNDLEIHWLFPDITRPRLNQAMEDCRGGFLFLKMNEFEDWDKVEGAKGKANSFSVLKTADDEGNDFGQDRVGAQSVNADGCLRLNWVADTTEPKLKKYFRYIHGEGPLSRITMGGIPEVEIGSPIPVYGDYDRQYDESIRPFIEHLKQATGIIVCQEAQRMARKLKAEIDEFTTLTQDRILDSLSHRALVAAFRKACLIYAANGMVWEKEIEAYCRWSMQTDLFLKYFLFAEDIRKATDVLLDSHPGPRSILTAVECDAEGIFTFEALKQTYEKQGRDVDERRLRNVLAQWKRRKYIVTVTDDSYKKCR
ncbi:MAG: hypothetical protein IJ544_09470 [Prevotella sp.]|nr:hypothetical protein [Prevotella sp.]